MCSSAPYLTETKKPCSNYDTKEELERVALPLHASLNHLLKQFRRQHMHLMRGGS